MIDYLRSTRLIVAAWFSYVNATKNTTRPAKSCVDFVAGYNAALDDLSRKLYNSNLDK